jgi:hypothetical protein
MVAIIVVGVDDRHHFPAIRTVRHGGDHQVDLALLQELHAVRRHHGHQFQFEAQLVGHVHCQIRLDSNNGAARFTIAIGFVIGLDADNQGTARLGSGQIGRRRSRIKNRRHRSQPDQRKLGLEHFLTSIC